MTAVFKFTRAQSVARIGYIVRYLNNNMRLAEYSVVEDIGMTGQFPGISFPRRDIFKYHNKRVTILTIFTGAEVSI